MQFSADDYDTIYRHMRRINNYTNRVCAIKSGGDASSCWCYKAAPNGTSLPCPVVVEKMPEPATEYEHTVENYY